MENEYQQRMDAVKRMQNKLEEMVKEGTAKKESPRRSHSTSIYDLLYMSEYCHDRETQPSKPSSR